MKETDYTEAFQRVLASAWDPIGVGAEDGIDEYRMYLAELWTLVMHRHATIEEVAATLTRLECDSMGGTPEPARARFVADRLVALRVERERELGNPKIWLPGTDKRLER